VKSDKRLKVGNDEYIFRCMKTSTGSRVLVQVGRLLLPHAKILSIFDVKTELMSIIDKPFNMEDMLTALGNHLQEDEMMKIVETVLEPCSVILKDQALELPSVYETHFAGEYALLFQVFAEAFKHNYASFFVGIPGIVKAFIPTTKGDTGGASATPTPGSGT
jgi:hypothetical protein